MALNKALKLGTAPFRKARKDAAVDKDTLKPMNEGIEFKEALKKSDTFESTPESILIMHEVGRACS
jgi:hypothetical protein